jgi:hypothetical protein
VNIPKLLCATAFVFACAASARAADNVTLCAASQGAGKSYWSWRTIDGRKCWYIGRASKPKSELRWQPLNSPVATKQQPEVIVSDTPSDGFRPAPPDPDNELANSCCWPDLATLLADEEASIKKRFADRVLPPSPAVLEPPTTTIQKRSRFDWIAMAALFAAIIWLARKRKNVLLFISRWRSLPERSNVPKISEVLRKVPPSEPASLPEFLKR